MRVILLQQQYEHNLLTRTIVGDGVHVYVCEYVCISASACVCVCVIY